MDWETRMEMADERLENEMFIDYLKDHIKELEKAIGGYANRIKEEENYKHKADGMVLSIKTYLSKTSPSIYDFLLENEV